MYEKWTKMVYTFYEELLELSTEIVRICPQSRETNPFHRCPSSLRVRKDTTSIYQRFSAHINSVDIPDLSDLRDSARYG